MANDQLTENELRTLFPGASEFVIRTSARPNRAPRQGDNALVQDAKNSLRLERQKHWEDIRAASHAPGAQRVDAKDRPQFRLRVTFLFSNYRVHDPDGCYSTLLDCIIAARRLLGGDTRNHPQKPTVRA